MKTIRLREDGNLEVVTDEGQLLWAGNPDDLEEYNRVIQTAYDTDMDYIEVEDGNEAQAAEGVHQGP